jgi:hypothetical protein
MCRIPYTSFYISVFDPFLRPVIVPMNRVRKSFIFPIAVSFGQVAILCKPSAINRYILSDFGCESFEIHKRVIHDGNRHIICGVYIVPENQRFLLNLSKKGSKLVPSSPLNVTKIALKLLYLRAFFLPKLFQSLFSSFCNKVVSNH